MTRSQYARYVGLRIMEALVIAGCGAILVAWLQRTGCLSPAFDMPPRHLADAPAALATVVRSLGWWTWPTLAAAGCHLILGPKQQRPVYLRAPGALYVYAGIKVDRQAGCRGGCITGTTGSGKTQACILPRLHSLCVNESWDAGKPGERIPPWGGLICGEKGNEWQAIQALLCHHGRAGDLRLLQTRPADSPMDWRPAARLNLLSIGKIPADTYAKMIIDTGLAVEEAERSDEFFVPQARDKIAWGIRLMRSVGAGPDLATLLDILTVHESYRQFLIRRCADSPPASDLSPLREARHQLENNYWTQPAEQLGGVRGTIYNFLIPFAEPEIAEVFSADSTFDLGDVEQGRIVCVALPQRYALQRRYVTTLLKILVYQIIRNRFDIGRDQPEWTRRNVLLIEQDEWQRHAVRADGDVDVIREAQGTTYAATQTQNAVWARLGGRERAAPLLANLRNRWICQAATDECADESAKLIGERVSREISFTRGERGTTQNVSFVERPWVSKAGLRTLPPFHVYFAPAEGRWLFVKCIAMPAAADGTIPPWWFGDWNIARWAAFYLRLPETILGMRLYSRDAFIPPWRARAPRRAQWRRILGLDGTFIILEKVSVRRAMRQAIRRR